MIATSDYWITYGKEEWPSHSIMAIPDSFDMTGEWQPSDLEPQDTLIWVYEGIDGPPQD